jgi:N6-adenosine-specific RNA methylase IME4
MWTTDYHLKQAIALCEAWEFKYSTVAFYWHKGNRPMVGQYTLKEMEQCLLFRRGSVPQPRGARNMRQFIMEEKREHSRKPDAIRNAISVMFPTQRKIELFSRGTYPGWQVWGNQVPTPAANDNFPPADASA